MGTGERRAVGIFALAVAGWLIPSIFKLTLGPADPLTQWAREGLREGVVAIVAASFLFVVPSGKNRGPILEWREAERIDWGTLFLLGGGIALGKMVFDTGLAQAIGEAVKAFPLASHPLGLLAAACTLVIYLTEVTSNSATTSMMLPVLIGIAQALGSDPVPVAVAVTMAASFAFMLPVSTPPNAMAYGTGLLRIGDMIKVGFLARCIRPRPGDHSRCPAGPPPDLTFRTHERRRATHPVGGRPPVRNGFRPVRPRRR